MSLSLRLYAAFGIAVFALCLALVVAMVIDAQMRPQSAADVVSSVDTGQRGN